MKVVLFCGGYGMRMRTAEDDVIPKPLQMVGPRPLLWHVMKYYAHYGHKDFILCLGYGAERIKEYFLSYRETESNDFVHARRPGRAVGVGHLGLVRDLRRHRSGVADRRAAAPGAHVPG